MTLRSGEIGPAPKESARVARTASPKIGASKQIRDALGAIRDDERFARLFVARVRPAEAP